MSKKLERTHTGSVVRHSGSFDWHLRGRMNRSVDLLNFKEQKSSFIAFTESATNLELPKRKTFSVEVKPSRKKFILKDILQYNSHQAQKYQLKMEEEKQTRHKVAAEHYNSLLEKIKATAKNQRRQQGFFTKLASRKSKHSMDISFIDTGNLFYSQKTNIQEVLRANKVRYSMALVRAKGLKPDTRELSRMLYWDKELILYGGFSHQAHPQVHRFGLTSREWRGSSLEDEKSDHRCFRLGHSATVAPSKLMVVFGGEMRDPISKTCVMSNEVL